MSDMRSFIDNIKRAHNKEMQLDAEEVVYRHLVDLARATSEVIVSEPYLRRVAAEVLRDLVKGGFVELPLEE